MEIWLDTIDTEVILDGMKTGIIEGVTTNPSILSKATNVPDTLKKLLEIQTGQVAVQVTSCEVDNMVEEGMHIYRLSKRMVVKVPVSHNGLIAIRQLKEYGVSIVATGILTPAQALLAYNLKVEYIAPYFSHMENPLENLKIMVEILKNKPQARTKILAASLREVDHIVQCAQLGVDVVTIKPDLYYKLVVNHPITENFCKKFAVDWSEQHGTNSIKQVLT